MDSIAGILSQLLSSAGRIRLTGVGIGVAIAVGAALGADADTDADPEGGCSHRSLTLRTPREGHSCLGGRLFGSDAGHCAWWGFPLVVRFSIDALPDGVYNS